MPKKKHLKEAIKMLEAWKQGKPSELRVYIYNLKTKRQTEVINLDYQ